MQICSDAFASPNAVLQAKMPLFGSFLDVEAGQAAAETGNMRVLRAPVVAPIIDPARLRHRAQNSQRFVCGTRLKLTCRAGSPLALWNPTRACPPSSRNRVPIIVCNVAGIVILLFLAGLVPFPSIFFLLLAMCAISSYIQYNTVIRQELERQSATTGTPGFQAQPFTHPEQAHHAAVFSMMGTLGLNEWRLGMMNRDFDESGILATCYATHCSCSRLQARGAGFARGLATPVSLAAHLRAQQWVDF